jgi:acetyl esterase/lipase
VINKELKMTAFFLNLTFHPSHFFFKILLFFSKLTRGKNIKGFDCDEIWIQRSNENSKIRTRIYKRSPSSASLNSPNKLPALLYFHGGGYSFGVPEAWHQSIVQFLNTRACVVIAPDYCKSGDRPYPAAFEDAYDTLVWIKENAESLGIRSDQIMVGGHSAGGGLCAAICLYARDKKQVNIAFQMPIYPMLDDRMIHPSAINNKDPAWNSKANIIGWNLYLKGLKEKGLAVPVYAAPAREVDYSNLPPAATFVGGFEPFKDETIEYFENLKKAGVSVEFRMFEGCFHGFEAMVPNAKISQEAIQFLNNSFAYAVDNYFAEQPNV